MRARIYQPARSAMQSGMAKTRQWVLEFDQGEARALDPLMGWTGSSDTQSQVRLRFETRAEAEAYAAAKGLAYDVMDPKPRQQNIRLYRFANQINADKPYIHAVERRVQPNGGFRPRVDIGCENLGCARLCRSDGD